MIIIGLTGGMGSGKSTVAQFLEKRGFPIYNSDERAKWLMNYSPKIKNQLIEWYGEKVYQDGILNRPFLAEQIFNDKEKLARQNALVHPEVFRDFEDWKNQQTANYIVKEAAILFESGSYKNCDWVVTVSSNEALRIARIMKRDHLSLEQIKQRLSKQWTDMKREEKADYIIKNEGTLDDLTTEVNQFIDWLNSN